jgi:hypothetical protein
VKNPAGFLTLVILRNMKKATLFRLPFSAKCSALLERGLKPQASMAVNNKLRQFPKRCRRLTFRRAEIHINERYGDVTPTSQTMNEALSGEG